MFLLCELLASDAVGPSWDFCAATVDYDIARKEASAIFDTKVTEVQSMVSKLLQTQRAAEQALDKYDASNLFKHKCRQDIYFVCKDTNEHVPPRGRQQHSSSCHESPSAYSRWIWCSDAYQLSH